MSELDNLGNVLREQMHASVSDLNPSDELWARIDAIPVDDTAPASRTPRGRRGRLTRRRIALALPLPVGALAATAALVLGGAAPSTSFGSGVTWLPNGDVNMQDVVLASPARANAVFRRLHYPAVVIPMTSSCPYHHFAYMVHRLHPSPVNTYWRAQKIDPRYVVVRAAKVVGRDRLLVALMGDVAVDHVPPCASSRGQASNGSGGRLGSEPKLP